MKQKNVSLPGFNRSAEFVPDTYNAERNTIDLVFSTGAQVKRNTFFGMGEDFIEELSMEKSAVRLDRLNAGAPVLNSHDASQLNSVLGVVEKARIENGQGIATIRFSKRADVQPIVEDVKGGVLRNISVGYKVHAFEERKDKSDGLKIFRATDWEPHEVSFVAIPADPGAQVRSATNNSCELTLRGDEVMEPKVTAPETKPQAPEIDLGKVRDEAKVAERARVSEITTACEKLGLARDFSDKLVADGVAIELARKAMIDELAKRDVKTATVSGNVEITRDENITRRNGFLEAILHRSNSQRNKLTDLGRQYRNMSMMDMVRSCLEAAGEKTIGMTNDEMVKRSFQLHLRGGMHTTSDFPLLLADTVNKTLRDSYEAAPQVWKPITREVSVSDFKTITRTQLGDAPALELLPEGADIKAGTTSESKESYAIETYAKMMRVSRKMIVNDDLSAFTRIPENFGRRAAELESDLLWRIILANAALNDGVALFHASHNNLSSGGAAAIAVASIGAARSAMRKQTGLNGARINIQPMWLFVPPELETIAQQFVTSIVPAVGSNVNPFANNLKVAVEPRLSDTTFHASASATAWYLTADAGMVDMLELARLQGDGGPVIESEDMFDTEGMKMKCRYDLGAKAIDYRGLNKNAGV